MKMDRRNGVVTAAQIDIRPIGDGRFEYVPTPTDNFTGPIQGTEAELVAWAQDHVYTWGGPAGTKIDVNIVDC